MASKMDEAPLAAAPNPPPRFLPHPFPEGFDASPPFFRGLPGGGRGLEGWTGTNNVFSTPGQPPFWISFIPRTENLLNVEKKRRRREEEEDDSDTPNTAE